MNNASKSIRRRRALINRRKPRLEFLEQRIVLDGDPTYFWEFGPGYEDHPLNGVEQTFTQPLDHTFRTPPGPPVLQDGLHEPNILTVVLDFNEASQPNTTDMFGVTVSPFDPTLYGFAATDFDLLVSEISTRVDQMYFDIPTDPTTVIPANNDYRIDFLVGDIGTPPVGVSEFYYVQIGEKVGNNPPAGVLGAACGSCIRDDATGAGPNGGTMIGDVVGSILSNEFTFAPQGDVDANSWALAGTIAHEIGHTLSLLHMDVAGSVTPLGIGAPVMGTGAIDLTTAERLAPREFVISGNNSQEGGIQKFHIQQLVNAVGTHLAATGQIQGTVFLDVNEDGVQGPGEQGLQGWEVYLDLDENGALDSTEPSTTTDVDGNYVLFQNIGPGTYTVREVVQPGFLATIPVDGVTSVTFTQVVETISNVDFGNKEDPPVFEGFKWIDTNEDGRFDEDAELPGAGFTIYLDLDEDGRQDFNEPAAVTREDGTYTIYIPEPGTYVIREATPPGFTQTFPTNRQHTVEVGPDESVRGLNFANSGQMHDFGNAPDSYGTSLASDGARHRILRGFHLGETMMGEVDQVNFPTDNDGVSFNGRLTAGQSSSVDVEVMTNGFTHGYVNLWIDFDGSGTFDSDEQAIKNDRRGPGVHTIAFDVPANAQTGETWARARYGWEHTMGPNGEAFAGEVEDYRVDVQGDVPQANDDFFDGDDAVAQDSANNDLDVLANDFESSAGPLSVFSVQTTSDRGGTVSVALGGGSVIYTPPAGFFGIDGFSYTAIDPLSQMTSADVTVTVTPLIGGPVALDDVHFFTDFPLNSFTDIPVLTNDFFGPNLPTRLNRIVTNPQFGTAVIMDSGTPNPTDDVIRYTPFDASVDGNSDLFTYEIVDSANNVSTAEVLVQLGANHADDNAIEITLGAFDLNSGQQIFTIDVGMEFELRAFIADIRDPIPPAGNGADLNGVFSGYFDVTVNKSDPSSNFFSATFVGLPTMTNNYPNAFAGDTLAPGEVNEAGGVQPVQIDGTVQGHGLGPIHIWSQLTRADEAGNIIFQPNPGDDVDLLTLLFDPPSEAEVSQISYTPLNIIALNPGLGEGEGFHNSSLAGDVDNNGRIDARDPLLLINKFVHERNVEGEANTALLWDVYQDNVFSLTDIIASIGYFRDSHMKRSGASGEGEFVLTQPLNSPIFADPLITPSSSDASLTSDVSPQRNVELVGPQQRVEARVIRAEGEGETANYARPADDDSSLYDRDWRSDLESTLENDDLLETIALDWENGE